jgi:ABC-2 type transport system permease protein
VNVRGIRAIVARDLKVLTASRPVMVPMVVVPALLFIGLPLLIGLLPQVGNLEGAGGAAELLPVLPEWLREALPEDEEAQVPVLLLTYLLAPLFLIVPLMVATVIAADSIAGERERGTLEMLLLSPVSDRDLLIAKVVGAWIPAVTISLAGVVIYGTVANLALGPLVDSPPFPNVLWTLLALWVAPAVAAVGLGSMVLISARVKGFQEAFQLGGLLVLPIVGLVVGQSTGALLLGPLALAVAGAVLWILALLILAAGARTFRRERLAQRL